MTKVRFEKTILPRQGRGPRVVSFAATAEDVERIARIERVARDKAGKLSGFQRPAIHAHIREIREYLSREDAILPNAIVLAFAGGASIEADGALVIDIGKGPPGWVVDGQQRLTAALYHKGSGFELVVSAFICDELTELNKQFILINNVRPLSKHLVYELLPGVEGLPHRLSDRSGAALLTEALNYRAGSSLHENIRQQTNPEGVVRDTILQKMLINSMAQGALRDMGTESLLEEGYLLTRNFFAGVKTVFKDDWVNHTPKSSRLVHGVGIVSMGYVMDELAAAGARSEREFADGLEPLRGRTHWTKGEWDFGDHRRPWNTLQNTNADFQLVSHYLVRVLRRASREAALIEAAE